MMNEIESRIRGILRRVARLEGEFSARADLFRDLGVRSIAALELLLSLEEEFGVSIADESFGTARNLEALVALVTGLAPGGLT
ncbi:MAG TPA: phosphopantetheine-binding protein [Polyangiaceae bacterium]